jgi:hypothetical protein
MARRSPRSPSLSALISFACRNQFSDVASLAGGKGGRDAAPRYVMDTLDAWGTRRVSNTSSCPAVKLFFCILYLLTPFFSVCVCDFDDIPW